MNNNIQKLNKVLIEKMDVNVILMSPPCQPFTRNGNFGDVNDARADPFVHVCKLIRENQVPTVDYILMENVKGFEKSNARELYLKTLTEADFWFQEFILTPTQLGIPNTRHRYYCIARRKTLKEFEFMSSEIVRDCWKSLKKLFL